MSSSNPLIKAIFGADEDQIMLLLASGEGVLWTTICKTLTPLFTDDGQHCCAKLLQDMVNRGVDVNETDYCNNTPLHYAVIVKCSGAIKFVFE